MGRSLSGLSKENLAFFERQEALKFTLPASKTISRLSTATKIASFIFHWPLPSSSMHIIQRELYIHPEKHNLVFSLTRKSRLRKNISLA